MTYRVGAAACLSMVLALAAELVCSRGALANEAAAQLDVIDGVVASEKQPIDEHRVGTSTGIEQAIRPADSAREPPTWFGAPSAGSTPAVSAAASSTPCSLAHISLSGKFDPSIDPYCHGDFVLDNIRITVGAEGGFDVRMNVFNRDEADASLEIYDSKGALVDSAIVWGNRKIPDGLYDLFVGNQWILITSLTTDPYQLLDTRNRQNSQLTEDVSFHVPSGGQFELTKRSNRAIVYNVISMALELGSFFDWGGNTIKERRINDIAKVMGFEVADLVKEKILSGETPDYQAVVRIVAAVGKVFLDPANLDGRRTFEGALKRLLMTPLGINLSALGAITAEGKVWNSANRIIDLEKALRNPGSSLVWNPSATASPQKSAASSCKPIPTRGSPPLAGGELRFESDVDVSQVIKNTGGCVGKDHRVAGKVTFDLSGSDLTYEATGTDYLVTSFEIVFLGENYTNKSWPSWLPRVHVIDGEGGLPDRVYVEIELDGPLGCAPTHRVHGFLLEITDESGVMLTNNSLPMSIPCGNKVKATFTPVLDQVDTWWPARIIDSGSLTPP